MEVDHCRKQQPFQIQVGPVRRDSLADAMEQAEEEAHAVVFQGPERQQDTPENSGGANPKSR